MTLIEILVALGIFVMLGSSLVMFLRDGISTWQIGEARREGYERAGAILDPISEDIRSLFSQSNPGPGGGLVEVLFLCDRDSFGRSRLRLVRALDDETRNPVSRIAGSLTGGMADIDYRNDAMEARLGILRAPGGLAEVAYQLGPQSGSETLWRGFKSPIGATVRSSTRSTWPPTSTGLLRAAGQLPMASSTWLSLSGAGIAGAGSMG